jgi:hypothetical protein
MKAVAVVTSLVCVGSAMAQGPWSVRCGEAEVRIVGVGAATGRGPLLEIETLPAGRYAVHFAPDALGKARSLQFAVPEQASVHIAAEAAGANSAETFRSDDPGWRGVPTDDRVRLRESALRSGRIEIDFEPSTAGIAALVARRSDSGDHYRCELDPRANELRLCRRLGGSELTLAKATCSPGPGRHRLAFQFEGFRLTAAFDEAPLLACFDGGLLEGRVGMGGVGNDALFTVSPVAPSRDSTASVIVDGNVELYGASIVTPGHWQVSSLWLDRPHPLVPTFAGLEPFLLQRPAAPIVMVADWRDSWCRDGIREIVAGGALRASMTWPDTPMMRTLAGLLRVLLISADGEAIAATSPAVPARR